MPELSISFEKFGIHVDSSISTANPLKQILLLKKKIKNTDYKIHAHLPRAELITMLACKNQNFIVTRHNCEQFFPNAPKFLSRFLSQLVSKKANFIIAISDAVNLYLVENMEVKEIKKIKTIHYGFEPHIAAPREGNTFKVQKNSKILVLGTISRLVHQKNLPFLIKAMSMLKQQEIEFELKIVGDGKMLSELEDLVRELQLEKNIKFRGKIDDIQNFMKELDVFVLTSRYEGFGMVLLEACDADLPIIAPRNTSIPEVLGSDYPGLYESDNMNSFVKKIELLLDPNYRNNLGDLSSQRKNLFSVRKMQISIDDIYEKI